MAPAAAPGDAEVTRVHEGYHAVNIYLAVGDARAAMDWYVDVLRATRRGDPIVMDDGRIGHAELRIGDTVVMLADEFPELDVLAPPARGGTSVSLVVYVPDVDRTYTRALEASPRAGAGSGGAAFDSA